MKCNNCKNKLEDNTKFCTNCGEKVSIDSVNPSVDKDISWYFLIISFLVGIPGGLSSVKNGYESIADLSNLEFLNGMFKVSSFPSDVFAQVIGASFAPLIMSSIIIGFIWGIKSIMSKSYKKPIQHIFIISVIFSILAMFAD
ncbi:MAG: zinc ribbon domain-containing protein [Campylobacteraceae bacterium]|nr:zinc ribbon domain-containing protein [Campylobacteraceae bacterium]